MRTALVTGASTGIGAATVHRLAAAGWHVLAGVRRPEDGERVVAEAGGSVEWVRLDVTEAGDIAALAERLGDRPLDGLVNNAGVVVAAPVEFVPLEDLRRQLEVNVVGQVGVTQAVIPNLRRARGRIVLIGSIGGRIGQPFLAPYCASKHALEAVADALRMELRPWGIRVVLLEPGAVRTPLWQKSSASALAAFERLPDAARERYGAAIARMQTIAERQERLGVAPETVAARVEHALTAARPSPRRLVGRDALPMLTLRRALGDRAFDSLVLRATGLPRTAPPS